jgi:DNA modification methylase
VGGNLWSLNSLRLGDLWVLGKHRIFCGSSLEASSYKALLAGRKANVVFADPPYNVTIEGNVSGKGAVRPVISRWAITRRHDYQ